MSSRTKRRSKKSVQRQKRLVYILTLPESAYLFLRGQTAYMRENGWDVHVISSPGPPLSALASQDKISVHNVPMARNPSPFSDIRSLAQLTLTIVRLKPSIVVSSTPKAGLLGTLASFIARVPARVYLVRGLRYEGFSGFKGRALKATELVASRAASITVAISSSVAQRLTSDGITRRKTVVLENGSSNGVPARSIRTQVAAVSRQEVRATLLGTYADRFVILFLGRHVPDKGLHHLLQVQSQTNGSVLLSAGPDTDDLSWTEPYVSPDLAWVCHPTVDDITPYLAAADVLVLPTKREGLGNVLLEAQAAGLPVITYDVTGARDAVLDGETGLLLPYGDLKALYRALERLRDNVELVHSMGSKGATWVAAAFDQRTLWAAYDRLYSDLIR